jgi:DNA modification methylase
MTVRILRGDVRAMLHTLEAESVDCVITSPPYWGLRDYGMAGQIGMEMTLGEHLAVLVEVFSEVRRVMKTQATLWLNYGDCYATSINGRSAAATKAAGNDDRTFRDKPFSTIGPILLQEAEGTDRRGASGNKGAGDGSRSRITAGGFLKPKDLCMIANRLAIALQDNGWWVRSEIVWGKNNPMPDSSGKYRPSTAHEKIFLLSKSAKSYYDAEAVALPCSAATHARLAQDVQNQIGSERANGGRKTNGNMKAVRRKDTEVSARPANSRPHSLSKYEAKKIDEAVKKQDGHGRRHAGFNEQYFGKDRKLAEPGSGTRNNSSMDGSLAIMPEMRYLRNYEPAPVSVWEMSTQPFSEAHFATFPPELVERAIMAGCPKGGTILDPFAGAGTTGLVADRMGRDAVLIELNNDYADIAERRIKGDCPMFAEVTAK